MVDPHKMRHKSTKWITAEHNAFQKHRSEAYQRKRRKAKATLEMQKRERALR